MTYIHTVATGGHPTPNANIASQHERYCILFLQNDVCSVMHMQHVTRKGHYTAHKVFIEHSKSF